MRKILITGGATKGYVNGIMNLTSMSSGKMATDLTDWFLDAGYDVTLIISNDIVYNTSNPKLKLARFDTAHELVTVMKAEAASVQYDIVIHTVVSSYNAEFTFRLEDLAQEITDFIGDNARDINESFTMEDIYREIFRILTNPECKMTNMLPPWSNLAVKLAPAVDTVYNLRKWFPNSFICGFKYQEADSEKALIDASLRLIDKSGLNLVFAANAESATERLVISRKGFHDIRVIGDEGIFNIISMIQNSLHIM